MVGTCDLAGLERDFLIELAYSASFEEGALFHGIKLHTAQFVDQCRVRMALVGDGWTIGLPEGDGPIVASGDLEALECDLALISLIESEWRV